MELWIRSQDRESIFKVKSVFYSTDGEKKHFIRTIVIDDIHHGVVELGQYSTKERALKVLDEIDERISLINSADFIKDKNGLVAFKNSNGDKIQGLACPYQMPKE